MVFKALAVMDKKSGKMLNYCQIICHPDYKDALSLSSANEFGRLANEVCGRIKNPTNTISLSSTMTFPKKDERMWSIFMLNQARENGTCCTQFVVGGNMINHPGKVATPTAEMLVAKILCKSVVSTVGAKFVSKRNDLSSYGPLA